MTRIVWAIPCNGAIVRLHCCYRDTARRLRSHASFAFPVGFQYARIAFLHCKPSTSHTFTWVYRCRSVQHSRFIRDVRDLRLHQNFAVEVYMGRRAKTRSHPRETIGEAREMCVSRQALADRPLRGQLYGKTQVRYMLRVHGPVFHYERDVTRLILEISVHQFYARYIVIVATLKRRQT